MIFKNVLATLAVGAMTSGVAMAESPNPNQININSIDVNGSGCPIGSVASDISADGQAFTLLFSEYIAEAGEGVDRRESRKSCQIVLDLHVPQGWQYSVFRAQYAGFANLERGTTGLQQTSYYFQGNLRENVTFRTDIRGPHNDDYQIFDEIGLESVVWSKCGVNRSLNLKTDLRVTTRGSAYALMTLDSIDGEVEHKYGVQWRRCN